MLPTIKFPLDVKEVIRYIPNCRYMSYQQFAKINHCSIDDIIPLIIGFERPDTCDIIYISDEILREEGIALGQSSEDANTPIEELKKIITTQL